MKEVWNRKRLGEVLDVQNGYAFPSDNFNSSRGLPLIRIRSLKHGIETETRYEGPYEDKYVVNKGDLLIGMDGEFGCYEWKGGPSLLNQRVCRLQGFSGELLPRFLFYGLNDYLKAIEDVTGFATVKHLSSKQILAIEFPIPPLPEQQQIVALLDEALAGLATAKANAEKNLQNARDICQSHLDSFLLQCGEQWEQKELGEVCELENGDRGENYPNKSARTATGVPFINAGHLTRQGLDMESMDFISRERFNLLGAGKVKPHDVLFCLRGSLGKHASVGDLAEGAIASSLVIIRPGPCLLDGFLLAYLGSSICSGMIDGYKNGAAQPNLSAQSLRRFGIPVPSLEEQQRICTEFEALSTEIQRLTHIYDRKVAALEELKKTLLKQAFNDEL